MPRNTGSRTLRYVTIAGWEGLKYGFQSGLKDTLRDNFGQTDITAATLVAGLVIGANSPKPARASKKLDATQGYESSFCSSDKIATLKADGYRISRPRPARQGGSRSLGKIVYVNVNSIKYGWFLPAVPAGFQNLSLFGHKDADANDKVVFGATFPKPARYKLVSADGTSSLTSFVEPGNETALLSASIVESAFMTSTDLAMLV